MLTQLRRGPKQARKSEPCAVFIGSADKQPLHSASYHLRCRRTETQSVRRTQSRPTRHWIHRGLLRITTEGSRSERLTSASSASGLNERTRTDDLCRIQLNGTAVLCMNACRSPARVVCARRHFIGLHPWALSSIKSTIVALPPAHMAGLVPKAPRILSLCAAGSVVRRRAAL